MTQPAPRFSATAQQLMTLIQRQSWLLLAMIVLAMVWEFVRGQQQFIISKNLLAGGLLAWLSHYIFAKLSLRTFGAKFRRQIVNNFYLAQAVKWMLSMIGFAIIFLMLKPLEPIWVFIGYFILQFGQIFLLYQYHKKLLNK